MMKKEMSHSSEKSDHKVDMLNGSLLDKIILFALPLAASSILQQLFNSADTAVVGRFASSQDMAAVGANSPVINLIVSLFVGLSVGANVTVARLIGQGKREKINDAIGTITWIAALSGILLLFCGILLASPILTLMNTPSDVLPLAVLYLRIYSFGMPFIMFYNFGSAILRSKGDSRRPLYALTLAGIVNVILNLILVIVFHLNVAGVAIATVISNIISSGLILLFLIRGEEDFRLTRSHLRIHGGILKDVLRIGIPAGIQGMIFSLSNTVIQSALNSFGSTVVAGSTVAVNMEVICYFAINAFNQAATTFMSQNFAAGKYRRCRSIFLECFLAGMIFCAALNYLIIFLHRPILSIFTTDPKVLHYAWLRITHVLAFQWTAATYEVTGSALRGMGYSMTPTVLTIFGCVGFRVFWVYAIFPITGSYTLLISVYLASWLLTGALVMGAYFLIARKVMKVS